MAGAGVVYLMYHELEVPGRSLCDAAPGYVRYVVSRSDFEQQMLWLNSSGWRGVSVGEALAAPQANGVVLSFDDGCETDLSAAAPLLKQLRFGATFYITVGYVGSPGHLPAAQVRELSDMGFEIGCHSMTHSYLSGLKSNQLTEEIAFAKIRLQHIIGRRVDHFSCPGGRSDPRVVRIAREAGYRSLATSRVAVNTPQSDPFALGRVAVMRDTSLNSFQQLCRGEGIWKLQLRDLTRSAAKLFLGDERYDRVRSAFLGG
jgi:peptidoglycan/xylan/chitin deacetylase (PgdA/CDA1 family)